MDQFRGASEPENSQDNPVAETAEAPRHGRRAAGSAADQPSTAKPVSDAMRSEEPRAGGRHGAEGAGAGTESAAADGAGTDSQSAESQVAEPQHPQGEQPSASVVNNDGDRPAGSAHGTSAHGAEPREAESEGVGSDGATAGAPATPAPADQKTHSNEPPANERHGAQSHHEVVNGQGENSQPASHEKPDTHGKPVSEVPTSPWQPGAGATSSTVADQGKTPAESSRSQAPVSASTESRSGAVPLYPATPAAADSSKPAQVANGGEAARNGEAPGNSAPVHSEQATANNSQAASGSRDDVWTNSKGGQAVSQQNDGNFSSGGNPYPTQGAPGEGNYGQTQPNNQFGQSGPPAFPGAPQSGMPGYPNAGGAPLATIQRPITLNYAVWLMFAGAVISLLLAIVTLASASSLADQAVSQVSGSQQMQSGLSAQQLKDTTIIGIYVGAIGTAVVSIALWLLMAFTNRAGQGWARIVATILAVIGILNAAWGIFNAAVAGAGLSIVLNVLLALVAAGILVLLWLKPTSEFFAAKKAAKMQAKSY